MKNWPSWFGTGTPKFDCVFVSHWYACPPATCPCICQLFESICPCGCIFCSVCCANIQVLACWVCVGKSSRCYKDWWRRSLCWIIWALWCPWSWKSSQLLPVMSPGEKGARSSGLFIGGDYCQTVSTMALGLEELGCFLAVAIPVPRFVSLVQLVQVEAQIHQVAEALRPRYRIAAVQIMCTISWPRLSTPDFLAHRFLAYMRLAPSPWNHPSSALPSAAKCGQQFCARWATHVSVSDLMCPK